MRARIGLAAFFDQIGEGFVNQSLQLPPFGLGNAADGCENIRVHLGSEFLEGGLGHGTLLWHGVYVMTDHEGSRCGGEPGALGETVLNPDGNGECLGSKEIRVLKRGDVVSFRTSGAGGYGEV